MNFNTYKAFYKGRQTEISAMTSFQAQKLAAAYFNARKTHEVTVVLIAKGDEIVLVPTTF